MSYSNFFNFLLEIRVSQKLAKLGRGRGGEAHKMSGMVEGRELECKMYLMSFWLS